MSWDAETITLDDEDHFETLNGLWTGKKPPFVRAGVIRNTNFTESGRIDYSDVAWLQVEQKQLTKRQLKSGDIIVERSGGGPKQPVGRVVFFTREDSPFSFSNFTSAIRVRDTQTFDAKFVFYGLLELYQSGQTEDIQRRTTGIRNLDFTAYKKRAAFPQILLAEQRKIAGVLGLVQRAIEQQARLIALTTELKKVLLHQLFTQGLRGEPQKQTEIGPVPDSWGVVKMGSIGKVVTGSTPKTKVPEYYSPPEVDFIAPADLGRTRLIYDSEKKISIAGLQTIRRLPKDAVMCVCIGSSIGKVGMTAKEVSATNQQINSIVCGERHESAFVYYLLSYLCDYWRGFATFGPVPILSKGSFEAIKIAVPPTKEEESEISRSLCALDAKAEVHMRKHAALTALFRTLLHQLMTAQIRVHDLDLPNLEIKQ